MKSIGKGLIKTIEKLHNANIKKNTESKLFE